MRLLAGAFFSSSWRLALRIVLCSVDGVPLFGEKFNRKLEIPEGLDSFGDGINYVLIPHLDQ